MFSFHAPWKQVNKDFIQIWCETTDLVHQTYLSSDPRDCRHKVFIDMM